MTTRQCFVHPLMLTLMLLVSPVFICAAESLDTRKIDELFASNPKAFLAYIQSLDSADSVQGLAESDRITLSYYKGVASFARSDYGVAESLFKEVLGSEVGLELKQRTLVSLTNLYQHQGDFYQAFVYGLQLNEDKFNSLSAAARSNGVMAMTLALLESGLYEEANSLLGKLDLSDANAKERCTALFLAAQIAYKGTIDVMPLSEFIQKKQQCADDKQQLYSSLTDYALSLMYLQRGQLAKAEALLQSQQEQALALGYENLTVLWHASELQLAVKQQNQAATQRALATLLPDLKTKAVEHSLEVAQQVYQALAGAYKLLGQPDTAFDYLEQYQQHYEKANNRQLSAALAYHAALMQAAQRKQEIDALNQQANQLQLETALAKAEAENQRLYLLVGSVLVLLLAALVVRSHRVRIKLKERVTYDKLTRVYSRDHFEELLNTALRQAETQQQELGFILFDLDHFKLVNDNHGHQAGDWALQQAANAAKECLRKSDAIGRIGGEEFAIVLLDCNFSQSWALAETVRQAIEALEPEQSGYPFKMTASFGVSSAKACGYHARKLISDADEAMYQAKQAGRNRVKPDEPRDNPLIWLEGPK
ncbi:GGDEF domain-containing protein [Rheinheimera sp.]|uniref:GGDEF domain-containing protein n=1 Tax=Rheinheimera sp. TaxID=1869214 RepID=UPI00307E6B99